jgi:hypothetical protein
MSRDEECGAWSLNSVNDSNVDELPLPSSCLLYVYISKRSISNYIYYFRSKEGLGYNISLPTNLNGYSNALSEMGCMKTCV